MARCAYTNVDDGTQFSRGYDRGNYGNAYESTDWESWYAKNCAGEDDEDENSQLSDAYREGMLLGFFSSYELHEIPDDEVAEQVEALRAKHGDE